MKPRRILLVDDDRDDRAMAALLLAREPGIEVDEAADGVAFAEKLARGEFELAIAAQRLGWADGLAVLGAVRRLYPHRPTLLLAAEAGPDLLAACAAGGADALLPKTSGGWLRLASTVASLLARRAAGDELARRTEELDRVNAELREFAHVVSHDLQAPLSRIQGYARLLGEHLGARLDDAGRGHLDRLAAATERMHGMLAAVLEYSRVESRGGERRPVALESVLDEVVETLRPAIEEAGGEVTHDPLPELTADRAQMVLLLQNLIGNALKFRREEPPSVHLSAARNGRGWDLTVADNGIGMSAEDGRRIFGMFQRLRPESEVPGSGVGLAICKRIVDRHGGTIRVASEPGRGSRFTVHLPDPPG